MSEFIAEAQVLIVPNTATFAATLRKQVEAAVLAAGPIAVPVVAAPVAQGATAAVAAQTAATQRQTAALVEQGAVVTRATAAQTQLTRAEKLQAETEGLLAGATELASLKTGELAQARSVLATISHALAQAEKAAAAAIASGDAALQASTAELLANTKALQLNARAAVKDAIAHHEEAAATAESAAAHAAATRGLAAETLALTGLRGATLAASAPFLIGATAAIVFAKSIKAASDETESINKNFEVFGDSAAVVEDFSKRTAVSLGISADQALEAAGIFGNLFRTIKISEPVAADMSTRLVQLASDLASFNNASPERTLEALRAGLVGQARPLRVFGIFLSAARVQQQALIDTGKKSVKQLTEAEKVQARFNLILRDSTIAQGDFARTSDRLANQSRILKAQLADLSVEIGRGLIPALTNIVGTGSNTIRILQDIKDIAGDAADSFPGAEKKATGFRVALANILTPGRAAKDVTNLLADALDKLAGRTTEATKRLEGFHFALGGLPAEIAAIQAAANQVNLTDVTTQLRGLEVERLKIQTGLAGGGRGAEEANLRKQIEDDKRAVDQSKSGTKARKEAIENLKRDQDDLARLLEEDASDARDRADRIKDAQDARADAARSAATAQADATQAFIESFSGRRGRIEQRLTSAQLFGTAKQQIALNKLIVAADKAEIEAIINRIRHLKLHGEALKIAKAAIQALNQEIFNTRNAILQLQAERKQALVDARASHLEAQLAIAETTKSTKDDENAQKALIKFDQVQIRRILAIKRRRRLTQDEAAQLDAYRVDLAQRNAALKDLKEEAEDTNKKFKELAFTFLQTQQGFAANLLGNLIPGFATGGLVGNASQAAQGPAALGAGPQDRVEQTAALGASKQGGVKPVQVDTTNQLLRQILAALNGRHTTPREIRNNRRTGHAMFDIF